VLVMPRHAGRLSPHTVVGPECGHQKCPWSGLLLQSTCIRADRHLSCEFLPVASGTFCAAAWISFKVTSHGLAAV
jgi:hypothetical protein